MSNIEMTIHGIKDISHGIIELPIENGVFAVVGSNGTGKSTIMSCLAQLLSRHNLGQLRTEDYTDSSYVEFLYNGHTDKWYPDEGFWRADSFPQTLKFNGTYEGSLFYGMRFSDSRNVDELMCSGQINSADIVDADKYIEEKLGQILHNNTQYYCNLKRIRNRTIADRLALKNTPYFKETQNSFISQYRMSSGECLLISLLHFIFNSLVRKSLPANRPILMLIDEVELALHPIAISNLLDLLQELTQIYENLTVILTSHSSEVIRRIAPRNIYKLERQDSEDNSFEVINPCYPSYAIRELYVHDGFDYLLLVEDILAKYIVDAAVINLGLGNSRLIHVLPVGGWENVLKLQYELAENCVLGVGTKVFSILDGDAQTLVGRKYRHMKKLFLPVNSVEKYLRKILITNPCMKTKKEINDRFFTIESLNSILQQYRDIEIRNKETLGDRFKEDNDGKRLYSLLLETLTRRKISEDTFIASLYEIIAENVNFDQFHEMLTRELT